MRKDRRLRMFGNGALKKTLWPKRDEVAGEWTLHNDAVEYYSDDHIKNEMGGACSRYR
jgi:hypothetical protein